MVPKEEPTVENLHEAKIWMHNCVFCAWCQFLKPLDLIKELSVTKARITPFRFVHSFAYLSTNRSPLLLKRKWISEKLYWFRPIIYSRTCLLKMYSESTIIAKQRSFNGNQSAAALREVMLVKKTCYSRSYFKLLNYPVSYDFKHVNHSFTSF